MKNRRRTGILDSWLAVYVSNEIYWRTCIRHAYFICRTVSANEFATSGNVPVWRSSKGNVLGRSHVPIYPTVPDAAAEDQELYDMLAVMDMLRGGRLRERRFAEQRIKEYLA